MNNTTSTSGYLPVNGLQLYYESYGEGREGQRPLVLLHGAFSAIGTSFGGLIPGLSQGRRVIGFEMQAHGRTADIERPLSMETMADDVAAALGELGIARADLFGYSMGAGVALRVAIRHPEVVGKLVLASVSYTFDGLHPGLMDGLGEMGPEMLYGSPWHEEYMRIAPDPGHFDAFFAKKNAMDAAVEELAAEALRAIASPVLLIMGDSDIVRPEHGVEMFRLFGGGRMGDSPEGLPDSQLAILPGTSHVSLVSRADLLLPMLPPFLDR